jgi:circadian clock protein KaiC
LTKSSILPPIEYSKAATGIEGLDVMLQGGIPRGRVIMVRGAAGVGKTILSMQFLHKGALKYNEKGMFVSLEETKEQLIREMYRVGMDLREPMEKGMITCIEASPLRYIPGKVQLGEMTVGKRDFSLIALAKKITDTAREKQVQRIVIDPLTALSIQCSDDNLRRTLVLDLIEALSQTKATCLVTEEFTASTLESGGRIDDYSVHGVVIMRPVMREKAIIKTIQILKMRETRHDDQTRIYRITDNGIVVYPEENVFR